MSNYSNIQKDFLLPDGTPDYLKLILTSRVYDTCKETPLTPALNLNAKLGVNILLKREDLQPVFRLNSEAHITESPSCPKKTAGKELSPLLSATMLSASLIQPTISISLQQL